MFRLVADADSLVQKWNQTGLNPKPTFHLRTQRPKVNWCSSQAHLEWIQNEAHIKFPLSVL